MIFAAMLPSLWPRRTMDVALEYLTLALFPIGAFVLGGRAKSLFPFSVYGALAAALPMHQYCDEHWRLGGGSAFDSSAWVEVAYLSALGLAMAFACRSAAWLRQRQFRRPTPDVPRCIGCGYILVGLPEPRCPECGMPFDKALCNLSAEPGVGWGREPGGSEDAVS